MSARKLSLPSLLLLTVAGMAIVDQAQADDVMVKFPAGYKNGVHYASVNRGATREELFISQDAIDAVRNGGEMPSGTVIMMEDYRNDKLYRYIVMEKRAGWGGRHAPEQRTGEWEFQWFNPDRSVKTDENLNRCRSCHISQASQDYVFTINQIRRSK